MKKGDFVYIHMDGRGMPSTGSGIIKKISRASKFGYYYLVNNRWYIKDQLSKSDTRMSRRSKMRLDPSDPRKGDVVRIRLDPHHPELKKGNIGRVIKRNYDSSLVIKFPKYDGKITLDDIYVEKVGHKMRQNPPYRGSLHIFHVNVVRHRMDDVESVFRKYHIQIVDSKALRSNAKTLWRYTIRTKFSGTAIMNMIKRKDRTIGVSVE